MREWSSGTQTDFTNYAARRLAERGLLREEDPIKLQRAVTEIAYSYARGGSSATGYVPIANSSPFEATARDDGLAPARSLSEQYDGRARSGGQQLRATPTDRYQRSRDPCAPRVGSAPFPGKPAGQRPDRSPQRRRSRDQSQDRQGTRSGVARRRHPERELQVLGTTRQGQTPTTAATERSGTRWVPMRASPTSALRPRSNLLASGISIKTVCRSLVPSRNRQRRRRRRDLEPASPPSPRREIGAAKVANGELLVDPGLTCADLEATETVPRHAPRGVAPGSAADGPKVGPPTSVRRASA
jgi:hypothetical protein